MTLRSSLLPSRYGCFAFLAGLAIAIGFSTLLLRHHDIGWHLAAGDLIRSSGSIPFTDPWAFTTHGYPWLNISWAWDIAASWLFELGSFPLLASVTAILLGLFTALTFYWCSMLKVSPALSVCGAALATLMIMTYQHPTDYMMSVAPQMLSLIYVAIYLMVLTHSSTHERIQDWRLLLLPLVMLFWVNTHGGYLLGMTLIGYFGLALMLSTALTHYKNSYITAGWGKVIVLAITGVLTLLAMLRNPLGTQIIEAVLRSMISGATASITEWQPFTFGESTLASFYLLGFILLTPYIRKQVPATVWVLSFIMLYLGLSQTRHFAFFILISLPLTLLAAQEMLITKQQFRLHFPSFNASLHKKYMDVRRSSLTLSVVSLLAISALLCTPILPTLFPAIRELPATYPKQEIAYLLEHHQGKRIYNHWNLGGYLIFGARDELKILIDGRAGTAYPEDVMALYHRYGSEQELVDKYDLDVAIIPNYLPSAMIYFYANPGWQEAFKGDAATVFERKN